MEVLFENFADVTWQMVVMWCIGGLLSYFSLTNLRIILRI